MINNMKNYGIMATMANVISTNCQVTNCGGNVVSIEQGGSYDFRNCTLANYFSAGGKSYPAVSISNYSFDTSYKQIPGDLTKAYFGNCIIYGAMDNEVLLDNVEVEAQFNYRFQNCLIKDNGSIYSDNPAFLGTIFNKDPMFSEISKNNYSIDSLSPARNIGDQMIATEFPFDLNNYSRLGDEGADLGALEWISSSKE